MAKLAARFGNFVQWFKRPHFGSRGKVAVKVDGPADGNVAVETIEIEESLPMKKLTKESAVEKLQRGYEEMVSLMGSVKNHLETQAQRSDRLINILEGLPEALKSLPEATRNQTRTLEAIQTNLSQQVQHNTKLADALNGLAKSTQHHEHAMSAIGQQLDAGHQRSEQILGSFNNLSGTLGRMTDANEATTGILRRMAEQESQAAEQVRQLFVRNQKQMTTMSVVSWSLALVALTVAGYVAVSVSKLSGQQAPGGQVSTPASNPAPSENTVKPIPASNPAPAVTPAAADTSPAATTPAPAAITPASEKPVSEEPSKTSLQDDAIPPAEGAATAKVEDAGIVEEDAE